MIERREGGIVVDVLVIEMAHRVPVPDFLLLSAAIASVLVVLVVVLAIAWIPVLLGGGERGCDGRRALALTDRVERQHDVAELY